MGYLTGEAGSPALAAQAGRHGPRRSPGAPQAPSAASLPWTVPQATWHCARLAIRAFTPSPGSEKNPILDTVSASRKVSTGVDQAHPRLIT